MFRLIPTHFQLFLGFSLASFLHSGLADAKDHASKKVSSALVQWSTQIGEVSFRTTLRADEVCVHADHINGTPIDLANNSAVGAISIRVDQGKRYRYELRPMSDGGMYSSLRFSVLPDQSIDIRVQLIGAALSEKLTSYSESGVTSKPIAELHRDAIDRQLFCPVSGQLIDPAGQPFHLRLLGKLIYCCSEECVTEMRDAGATSRLNPVVVADELRAQDLSLIDLQQNCPVMGMALGSMGPPVKLVVGKQPLFLCCKGCIPKIQANPIHYVNLALVKGRMNHGEEPRLPIQPSEKLMADGVETLPDGVFRVDSRDQVHIAAQKVCPVMDEPLDAMGGPYKVNVRGKAVYICCPGCAVTLNDDPIQFLGDMADRDVHPPMFR